MVVVVGVVRAQLVVLLMEVVDQHLLSQALQYFMLVVVEAD